MAQIEHSASSASAHKVFIPLENNPDVMTKLAHTLGLSQELEFHDVYSLTDPDLLAILPRPAHALLFIHPMTELSEKHFNAESEQDVDYHGSGPDEPVMFYSQIIQHACGLIGLLHCTTNGYPATQILPGSNLDKLVQDAIPLKRDARAQLLHDSEVLEAAHDAAAHTGDTVPPERGDCPPQAFVAFVKGADGHLYELEGRRKGPIDRGILPDGADVLSEEALRMGPLPFLQREELASAANVMFSCTVLA